MTGPQRCCCIWGREAPEKDWQRPRDLLPQRYWHLRRWGRPNWRLAWQQVSRGCLRQNSQLRVTVRVPPCQGNIIFLVKSVHDYLQHFDNTRYLAVVDWRSPQKVTLWPWPRTTTMSWSWTRSTLIRTERELASWLAGPWTTHPIDDDIVQSKYDDKIPHLHARALTPPMTLSPLTPLWRRHKWSG